MRVPLEVVAAIAALAGCGDSGQPDPTPAPATPQPAEASQQRHHNPGLGPPPGAPGGPELDGPGGKQSKTGQPAGTGQGHDPRRGRSEEPATFEIIEKNDMVKVTAGWTTLGPRTPPPPPTAKVAKAPPPGAQEGPGSAKDHAAGGAARQAGGPAGMLDAKELARRPGVAAPWEFYGGNGVDKQRVWLDAFWIDRTEVTRAAYKRFLDDTGYRPPFVAEDWADDGWNWDGTNPPPGTEDHPVVLASLYDAMAYCTWAGKRLPTEAEWQLAALGPRGRERHFPWGDTYDAAKLNHGKLEAPNFDDSDGYLLTSPAGAYPGGASPFGAVDMFGNAWEFTADTRVDDWSLMQATPYEQGYRDVTASGPGLYTAVRGGSYFFDLSLNPAGERHAFLPEIRRKTSGFRCARTQEPS